MPSLAVHRPFCYMDWQHHHTPKSDGIANTTAYKWENKNKQKTHLKYTPEVDISSVSHTENYFLPSYLIYFRLVRDVLF